MIPTLAVLRRFWPLLALLLAVLALRWWGNNRFEAGEKQGRAACEAAAAEAARVQERADRARVERADTQLAQRADAGAAMTIKEIERVEIRWRDRPAVECIAADGVRDLEAARAAIRAAAAGGRDAAVPDGDPAPAAD